MTNLFCKILTTALLISALPAFAQSPVCMRLQSALSSLETGQSSANNEEGQGYEQAIGKQQAELDRLVTRARRLDCDGIFVFTERPRECIGLSNQIGQMRLNIERMYREMDRQGYRRSDPVENNLQRRQIIEAMFQNGCNPSGQQRQEINTPQRDRDAFSFQRLFGGAFGDPYQGPSSLEGEGGYRTVCVRQCDGFYFPISFSTSDYNFEADEVVCRATCPAQDVSLYVYHNQGETIEQAVSFASGRPYTALPNALRYRKEYDQACSCRRQGESWRETLSGIQEKLSPGDILVTEENARKLTESKNASQGGRNAKPDTPQPAPAQSQDATRPETPQTPPGQIRTVGPQFTPQKNKGGR